MKWNETVRTIAAMLEAERGHRNLAAPAGWDPYDVWLNRIHAPRAARAQQAALPGIRRIGDFTPTPTPTT